MTLTMPQIESCKVKNKLDEILLNNRIIHTCNEKFVTHLERLKPPVENKSTFGFVNSWVELVLLIRICSDIVCFMYTTSAPVEVATLFFFIISLLGLIFTFLFIVSYVWNVMQKSKTGEKDYKFEVVFCVTWSVLYGVFTTLIAICNQPAIIPVFCGYLSMICYSLDGYWKCTRERKFHSENDHATVPQRYCPIQIQESSDNNKLYTAVNFSDKSNCDLEMTNILITEVQT